MRKIFFIAILIFSVSSLSAQSVDSDTIVWDIDEFEWGDFYQEPYPCDYLIARMDSIFFVAEDLLLKGKELKALEGFYAIITLWQDSVKNVECYTVDYNYLKELYVWSLWDKAYILNKHRSTNDVDCLKKIIDNWIDSSNTFFLNTIEIERKAARVLSADYYNIAQLWITDSNHVMNSPDSEQQTLATYFNYLKMASGYYDLADVKFYSVEDIQETDYIEWAFRTLNDTVSINKRNDQIGEFFYNHHTKLYKGLDNVIEMPDSTNWDTIPYAAYPMIWLTKSGRYEDALRYYDSIEDRFRNDLYVGSFFTTSLFNLGYYGEGIEAMAHGFIINSEGTGYFSPKAIQYTNIWTHYYKHENELTIFLCDSALLRERDPWLLLIRGICNNRLADRSPTGSKHDYYLDCAYHDYAESIHVSDSMGIPQDPFPYALLGRQEEAVKIAEHDKDSLLTADSYLTLAQIYCIVGEREKAQKNIHKSLEMDHSVEQLSYVLTLPYLTPVREFLSNEIDKYVSGENGITLNRLEADTLMTFVYYKTLGRLLLVPCIINGIEINDMIFDSGAEILQISKEMAEEMRQNGTLSDDDFLRMEGFTGAFGGESSIQPLYNFRTVKIGNIELHNVTGTVVESADAPILLGQTVLSNFIIEMNPQDRLLTLKQIKYRR